MLVLGCKPLSDGFLKSFRFLVAGENWCVANISVDLVLAVMYAFLWRRRGQMSSWDVARWPKRGHHFLLSFEVELVRAVAA